MHLALTDHLMVQAASPEVVVAPGAAEPAEMAVAMMVDFEEDA
tara:strand:+ start:464 stop:592 length:129 start_codon:yes stop_codon:yes gene_type:complete